MPAPSLLSRAERFFYLRLGGLVSIVVYFAIFDAGQRSEEALRTASVAALSTQIAYVALARWRGELKQFDLGFLALYALSTAAAWSGTPALVRFLQLYSSPLVFAALTLTAALPPLFGAEPFVFHFMRRTVPAWQLRMAVTDRIGRLVWIYWIGLFALCTILAASHPLDPLYTLVYPNLLLLVPGLLGNRLLPLLYLKLFPPETPETIEPWIMGMPSFFDRRAAADVRADIQFRFTGDEAGEYWLRIDGGRCASFEGASPAADVTVVTTGPVWRSIVRGETTGEQAALAGTFAAFGDVALLSNLPVWFPWPQPSR